MHAQEKQPIRFERAEEKDHESAKNRWHISDAQTAINLMPFKNGRSCLPKPERLAYEIMNDTLFMIDQLEIICTRDISYTLILVLLDTERYPQFERIRIVYTRNREVFDLMSRNEVEPKQNKMI